MRYFRKLSVAIVLMVSSLSSWAVLPPYWSTAQMICHIVSSEDLAKAVESAVISKIERFDDYNRFKVTTDKKTVIVTVLFKNDKPKGWVGPAQIDSIQISEFQESK